MRGGKKMKMVGPIPNEFAPTWPQQSRPDNFVFAPHWYVPPHRARTSTDDRYDLNTLFKKSLGFMTVDVQGMARVGFFQPHHTRDPPPAFHVAAPAVP